MLDTTGKVAEGSGCNLFIVRDGTLITAPDHRRHPGRDHPPHDAPVRRATPASPTEEREIDRSELYVADEAFFCGTGVQVARIEPSTAARSATADRPDHHAPADRHSSTPSAAATRYADWITRVHVGAASRGAGAAHR